jgi:hypothetical protein
MGLNSMFKAERAAVVAATKTAADGINLSVVVSTAALLIAAVALFLVVTR